MNSKQAVYQYLDNQGIPYEVTEHQAVYTMEELAGVPLPYPEAMAKNLFVCDDKKRAYYLITAKGDKRVDLKAFRRAYGTRPLSLAHEEDLASILGLQPGSVTPLGILNDASCQTCFCLDKDFLMPPARIGIHPNDNTATLWLKTEDLIRLVEAHGNEIKCVPLPTY